MIMAHDSDSNPDIESPDPMNMPERPIMRSAIFPLFSSRATFYFAPMPEDDDENDHRVVTPLIPTGTSTISPGFVRRFPV